MPQPQPPQQPWSLDERIDFLLGVGQVVSKPVEMALRVPSTAGRRFFNAGAGIGLFAMLFWVGADPALPPVYVVQAFNGGLVLLAVHGLGRRLRPGYVHSHYTGLPWVCLLTGVDERFAKSVVEPALVAALAWAASGVSRHLTWWLLASAASLVGSNAYIAMRDAARISAAMDARIEQQSYMAQMTGMAAPQASGTGRRGSASRIILLAIAGGLAWYAWSAGATNPGRTSGGRPEPSIRRGAVP